MNKAEFFRKSTDSGESILGETGPVSGNDSFTGIIFILILAMLIFVFTGSEANARGLKPTSMGRALDKTYSPTTDVIFDGGLSHDNDSQTRRYLQRWKWDFDYDIDFNEFTLDLESYSPLVSHRYTTPGTYVVGVKYIDDDGVEGDVYLFTVVVSSIKRYYYVKDHLGSIRQTIDDNGVVVDKQDYSSYGAILPGRSMNTASPNEKYKFTEKERDKESGLDYFGARYYDSEVGRWLSIDPLADKYPGWSPYNYCINNPLVFIDPNGMDIYIYGKDSTKIGTIITGDNNNQNLYTDFVYNGKDPFEVDISDLLKEYEKIDAIGVDLSGSVTFVGGLNGGAELVYFKNGPDKGQWHWYSYIGGNLGCEAGAGVTGFVAWNNYRQSKKDAASWEGNVSGYSFGFLAVSGGYFWANNKGAAELAKGMLDNGKNGYSVTWQGVTVSSGISGGLSLGAKWYFANYKHRGRLF